jgi:hypothetical protein
LSREELARRQADLVAALVAGAPAPAGFDPTRIRATTEALLRKRAAEVAAQWPALRAELGPQWRTEFTGWARGRPPRGSLRDGWDFARARAALGPRAALELATRTVRLAYDGVRPPRPRRLPALRRAGGSLVVQIGGRVFTLPRAAHR